MEDCIITRKDNNRQESLIFSFILILSIVQLESNCQTPEFKKDTSYTYESALIKVIKNNQHKDIVISAPDVALEIPIQMERGVPYFSINDRVLLADLYYPKNKSNYKGIGVIIIHGGGWKSGDKELMTPISRHLAAKGYVVMAPEYRLSPEAKYPAAVQDLYKAFTWLADHSKEYQIDIDQMVVIGCSAGGQLAALVGSTYNKPENQYQKNVSGKIAAMIDIDGILAFNHRESKEGKVASEWLGGNYMDESKIWEEASALNHVDQHTPPTLFLASHSPRFLAGRMDFIEKLDSYNTPHQTHFLDRAPHSFWLFNPWFEPTVNYISNFLEKHLFQSK